MHIPCLTDKVIVKLTQLRWLNDQQQRFEGTGRQLWVVLRDRAVVGYFNMDLERKELLSSKNSEFRFYPQTQQVTILDLGSRYGTAKLVTDMKQIPEGALAEGSSFWV